VGIGPEGSRSGRDPRRPGAYILAAAVPAQPASLRVEEHTAQIAGGPVFWRSAAGSGSPVLYLHGVPTSSDLWPPFLTRTGGLAPDLPGFGRSGKRADGDYTIDGYGAFLEAFLEHLGVERYRLVVHDWGAVGLALAQRHPQRLERLVVFNSVPLLAGYRWHRVARVWRTPVVGELAMGATTRWVLRQLSREANARPGPLPDDMIESIWSSFDQGTQRAILRLYRSSPPDVLGAAGARLSELTAPALVLWGAQDPYIPFRFARAYAERLPNARLRLVEAAGHWPWLDEPALIDEACAFLGETGFGAPGER
jgi:pimeloyl-ACP methyl ester carboxylesterase